MQNVKIDLSKDAIAPQSDSLFAKLPKIVLINIMTYLDGPSFQHIQLICKKLYVLSHDDYVWHHRFYLSLFPEKAFRKTAVHGTYQKCMDLLHFKEQIKRSPPEIKDLQIGEFPLPRQLECHFLHEENQNISYYDFNQNKKKVFKKEFCHLLYFTDWGENILGHGKWILLYQTQKNQICVWNTETDQLQSLPANNDLALPDINFVYPQPRAISKIYNSFSEVIHGHLLPTIFWKEKQQIEIRLWNLQSQEFWDPQFHQYQYRLSEIDKNQDIFAFDYQGEYVVTFHKPDRVVAWNIKTALSYPLSKEIINHEMWLYSQGKIGIKFYIYENFFVLYEDQVMNIWNITTNQLTKSIAITNLKIPWNISDFWLFTKNINNSINIFNITKTEKVAYEILQEDLHKNEPGFLENIFSQEIINNYFIYIAKVITHQNSHRICTLKMLFFNLITGNKSLFSYPVHMVSNVSVDMVHSVAAISFTTALSQPIHVCLIDLSKRDIHLLREFDCMSHYGFIFWKNYKLIYHRWPSPCMQIMEFSDQK